MSTPNSIDEIMKRMNDRAKAEGRYLGQAFWEVPAQGGSILDVPLSAEATERVAALRARRAERKRKGSREGDAAGCADASLDHPGEGPAPHRRK
jgi:hypothetical protein